MVDVFGRAGGNTSRGKRGHPGRPGGIKDLCLWAPHSLINHFRQFDESGCFLLEKSTDVEWKNKKISVWKSRTTKGNLIGTKPAKNIEIIYEGVSAIDFLKNQYKSDLFFIPSINGVGFVCISFMTDSDDEQILIGHRSTPDIFKETREIKITGTEIFFTAFQEKKLVDIPIMNDNRKWTTLFLQYIVTDDTSVHFRYTINGDPDNSGQFSCDKATGTSNGFSLGSSTSGEKFFSGKIHGLEMYFQPKARDIFPDELIKLISKYHKVEHRAI